MGKLFAVVGHSGAGKTTTMRATMGTDKECVSVTTRLPRDGEVDGKDYFFVSKEEFYKMDEEDKFAEKSTYFGSALYGMTNEEIDSKLSKGDAFIVVDIDGLRQLKQKYPELVSIFLYTSKEEAEKRMIKDGRTKKSIESRLSTYEAELMNRQHCDYVIRNVGFYSTCIILGSIVRSESDELFIITTPLDVFK
jgi:guanylate kinase